MAGLKAATMTTKRSGSPYDLVNIGNLLRRRAGSDCRRATIGLANELEKVKARLDELEEARARIAELEEAQRWIPVSERLPERDGFYLVLENVNQVAGYYHWCKVFGWNTDGGRTNIQSVTHWMPLPEPPEVEK